MQRKNNGNFGRRHAIPPRERVHRANRIAAMICFALFVGLLISSLVFNQPVLALGAMIAITAGAFIAVEVY